MYGQGLHQNHFKREHLHHGVQVLSTYIAQQDIQQKRCLHL